MIIDEKISILFFILITSIILEDYRIFVFGLSALLFKSFIFKENLSKIDNEILFPTLNDPFQNNIDSDVLKELPAETDLIKQDRDRYFHWNYYKDLDSVYDRRYDGLSFYTTPPDNTDDYIKFLGYNTYASTANVLYEDQKLQNKKMIN